MKLIIAGGRYYRPVASDFRYLDQFLPEVTEVVSGGASGMDAAGEEWAQVHGLKVVTFRANWSSHGAAAGPRRNRQMANYADAVVLFPGDRGTDSMYAEARRAGITIHDLRIERRG